MNIFCLILGHIWTMPSCEPVMTITFNISRATYDLVFCKTCGAVKIVAMA